MWCFVRLDANDAGVLNYTEHHRRVVRASEEWTGRRVWLVPFQCYADVRSVTPLGLVFITVVNEDGVVFDFCVDLDMLGTQVVSA